MGQSKDFLDDNYALERLKSEYNKYKTLYVSFDFDNTIFDNHNLGLINTVKIIELLQKAKKAKFKLILYTICKNDSNLNFKLAFCKIFGIEPDYVNESPLLADVSRNKKPFYNILLDDRAGLGSSYRILNSLINSLPRSND